MFLNWNVKKNKDTKQSVVELKKMMSSNNKFDRIKAASALAICGFADGLSELQDAETSTNSQVEFFYAKASLFLLGQYRR